MKNTTQQIKMIALGIVVAASASYAFAWTGPTSAPPGGNVAAPINVSTLAQAKLGNLVLNGLSVNTGTILNGIVQLAIGGAQPGYVLEASDTSGTVKWAPISGSSGVTGITAGNNVTISPTSGIGNVTVNAVSNIIGGCYYSVSEPNGTSNIIRAVSSLVAWGKNVSASGNSCTCPSGYTPKEVDQGPPNISFINGTVAFPYPTSLCVEN